MHIVDSLILELGIDLSRFEQQAKKAEQAQKKLEESGKKAEKAAQSSEKQHKKTAEQMDKLGMNVIPVPFRDAYAFGGGLHCATADVYREGGCEDYFPNQVADPTLV